jgi:acyl-[acyl-carrier-protein]-phospholipid O-acyltransferase/long-chain-fatty-acid--[acyl-carrier-protein] ligase
MASPAKAHAATTIASDRRGELIILFTEDATLDRARLLAQARQTGIPEVSVPRSVFPIDKLPRLGSGKVDYVRLGELARAAAPRPQAANTEA